MLLNYRGRGKVVFPFSKTINDSRSYIDLLMVETIDDITGVGPATTKQLQSVGIETVPELADAEIDNLTETGMSESKAEKLVNRARESAILIQSTDEREAEYEQRTTVPTGIGELDEILDGGWESENIIAIYGASGSGKTQLSFQSLVAAVEATGKPAVYIETERNRFRPERIKQMANEDDTHEKIFAIPAYDLDSQYNAYNKVKNAFTDLSLIVVDSFNSRFRLSEKFEGRGTLSSRSAEMGKHIRAIEDLVDETECPILLSSQIYDSPTQYGGKDHPWGANVWKHSITYLVYLKETSGDVVTATVENHPSLPEREINLHIRESGIDGMPNR